MQFRYVAVWIVGILVMLLLRSVDLFLGGIPAEAIPWALLRTGGLPGDWLVFWSLLVLLWWARDQWQSSPTTAPKARQFDYLLLWVLGLVVVVNWGLWILATLSPLEAPAPDQAAPSGLVFEDSSSYGDVGASIAGGAGLLSRADSFSTTIALIAAWSAIVIVVLLFAGDGVKDGFYDTTLAPYKGVLTTVTVVILLTLLANVFAYFGIQSRVRSLDAPVILLNQTVTNLAETADSLHQVTSRFEQEVALKAWDRAEGQNRQAVLNGLAVTGGTVVQLANETSDLAYAAVNQLEAAVDLGRAQQAGAASSVSDAELTGIMAVLDEAQSSANSLIGDAASLQYKFLPYLRREAPFVPVQLEADLRDIANHARTTSLRATAASEALTGLESRGTSIFLWLAAFYSSFVLFPWVLLLMFFYRKREFRAIEIIADLKRLDPSNKLLQRALGTESSAKQLSTRAVDDLLERAFGNREYVLSVALLTVLIAAGWYYFLYPRADIGISELVRSDAGITQLTTDLAEHASPLTMGFAGAYFFVAQMLLRRYLSGDLYPSAFLQGAVRIIWVFTLSVALAVLLPRGDNWMKFASIIAFVAGIFPREGLRVISSAASGLVTRLLKWAAPDQAFPTDTEVLPLTQLDGINIWVESRLLEENVENVQGMATAPIERLVAGTYYPASRIVDWVDQAILLTHCGQDQQWCPPLQAVGIRTATDLLDAASPASQTRANPDELTFDPSDPSLVTLEKAVAEAAAAGAVASSKKVTRIPKLTATILSQMCKVIWPDPNLRYIQRYRDSSDEDLAADDMPSSVLGTASPLNGNNGASRDEMVAEVVGAIDGRLSSDGAAPQSESDQTAASPPEERPAPGG